MSSPPSPSSNIRSHPPSLLTATATSPSHTSLVAPSHPPSNTLLHDDTSSSSAATSSTSLPPDIQHATDVDVAHLTAIISKQSELITQMIQEKTRQNPTFTSPPHHSSISHLLPTTPAPTTPLFTNSGEHASITADVFPTIGSASTTVSPSARTLSPSIPPPTTHLSSLEHTWAAQESLYLLHEKQYRELLATCKIRHAEEIEALKKQHRIETEQNTLLASLETQKAVLLHQAEIARLEEEIKKHVQIQQEKDSEIQSLQTSLSSLQQSNSHLQSQSQDNLSCILELKTLLTLAQEKESDALKKLQEGKERFAKDSIYKEARFEKLVKRNKRLQQELNNVTKTGAGGTIETHHDFTITGSGTVRGEEKQKVYTPSQKQRNIGSAHRRSRSSERLSLASSQHSTPSSTHRHVSHTHAQQQYDSHHPSHHHYYQNHPRRYSSASQAEAELEHDASDLIVHSGGEEEEHDRRRRGGEEDVEYDDDEQEEYDEHTSYYEQYSHTQQSDHPPQHYQYSQQYDIHANGVFTHNHSEITHNNNNNTSRTQTSTVPPPLFSTPLPAYNPQPDAQYSSPPRAKHAAPHDQQYDSQQQQQQQQVVAQTPPTIPRPFVSSTLQSTSNTHNRKPSASSSATSTPLRSSPTPSSSSSTKDQTIHVSLQPFSASTTASTPSSSSAVPQGLSQRSKNTLSNAETYAREQKEKQQKQQMMVVSSNDVSGRTSGAASPVSNQNDATVTSPSHLTITIPSHSSSSPPATNIKALLSTKHSTTPNPTFHDQSPLPASYISLSASPASSALPHKHQTKYRIVDAEKRVSYLHHTHVLPSALAARNQTLVGMGDVDPNIHPDTIHANKMLALQSPANKDRKWEPQGFGSPRATGGNQFVFSAITDGKSGSSVAMVPMSPHSTLNTSTTMLAHRQLHPDKRTRPLRRDHLLLSEEKRKQQKKEQWYVLGGDKGALGFKDVKPKIDARWQERQAQIGKGEEKESGIKMLTS